MVEDCHTPERVFWIVGFYHAASGVRTHGVRRVKRAFFELKSASIQSLINSTGRKRIDEHERQLAKMGQD